MGQLRKVPVPSGINLVVSERRIEDFDKSNGYRKIGSDNLYYQHLRDFALTSPTFALCIERQADTLFGEYDGTNLLTDEIVSAILKDYSTFGGFALNILYNGLGDIDSVMYVPFESIRLGEQNAQGKYTYCYQCADWSGASTANGKKINPRTDKTKFFMFTTDIETRLRRMEQVGVENYRGEILYFSNTNGYPTSPADAVIGYISAEVGLSNIVQRDVRQSFLPSGIVSIPNGASENDQFLFQEQLSSLQGDNNCGKLILFASNSKDEQPTLVPLTTEGMDTKFENTKKDCKEKIIGAYHQEAFIRLAEGGLGFGSDTIGEVYKFYSFSLRTKRKKIVSTLKQIDPNFELPELVYLYENKMNNNIES